jgi:hypothetical protein
MGSIPVCASFISDQIRPEWQRAVPPKAGRRGSIAWQTVKSALSHLREYYTVVEIRYYVLNLSETLVSLAVAAALFGRA